MYISPRRLPSPPHGSRHFLTGRFTGRIATKALIPLAAHGFTGKKEIYDPSPHFLGLQVVAAGFLFPCPDIPDNPATIRQNRLSKRDKPTLVRARKTTKPL